MPRDLLADQNQNTLDQMPQLSREPGSSSSSSSSTLPGSGSGGNNNDDEQHSDYYSEEDMAPNNNSNRFVLVEDRFKKMQVIHPFAQLLNVDDLDDCDWLEHVAFDPIEAATREKLEYRLRTSGELCTGLFTSAYATTPGALGTLLKTRSFPSIDSSDSDRKRILLGHIISTKSRSPVVTDASMDYPRDFRTRYQLSPPVGHDEDGETVCIHSLCVHPEFSGKGLGQVLLKSYVQRIRDSGVAKRVALICRERLVGWYERAGFEKVGPSKCQYGGGNWVDMVLDFEAGMEDEHDF